MAELLVVKDLGFRPRGTQHWILKEVEFSIEPGEIVLIAGATGSGKTTLLNCLSGIAPQHTGGQVTGKIALLGRAIEHLPLRERSRSLGSVLQNVEMQLFTDRVSEELAFGLENLNIPAPEIQARIVKSLQEFSLATQQQWPITKLSAGQKQRLVLACVLAMDQPILLLDEPFAYLDRSGCLLLCNLLRERAQKGQSIVLVEHRLELAQSIAHRTYFCVHGRLQEGLPKREIRHDVLRSSNSGSLIFETHQLRYGGYPPLPNLSIKAGEAVLLRGDNGCGKTTLLKLIGGLLKPESGTLTLGGEKIDHWPVSRRAKAIGFVLQNPNHQLFAETVRQEIAQPGVSAETAQEILESLNLTHLQAQHPQSLSQGQKRRLALGAVLARQPKLCLLDEITVGQDPASLALMLCTLQKFTERGGAVLLTSHDPEAALRLGARIINF